jgi:hypothetical protein
MVRDCARHQRLPSRSSQLAAARQSRSGDRVEGSGRPWARKSDIRSSPTVCLAGKTLQGVTALRLNRWHCHQGLRQALCVRYSNAKEPVRSWAPTNKPRIKIGYGHFGTLELAASYRPRSRRNILARGTSVAERRKPIAKGCEMVVICRPAAGTMYVISATRTAESVDPDAP